MISHEDMDDICDIIEEELCDNFNMGSDSPRFHMNNDYSEIIYCTSWYKWYRLPLSDWSGDTKDINGFLKSCIRLILGCEWADAAQEEGYLKLYGIEED